MNRFLTLLVVICLGWYHTATAQVASVFTYTGSIQSYTVPAGITSVTIDARGACGGLADWYYYLSSSSYSLNYGGYGARVVCSLWVTPGQVLYVYVGGNGDSSSSIGPGSGAGGWNGGGNGIPFSGPGTLIGAGGGGASDVRIGGTALTDRVLVAGGGGGGVASCAGLNMSQGGAGGGLTGEDGYVCTNRYPTFIGGGGSQTAGGAAAIGYLSSPLAKAGGFGYGGDGCTSDGGGGGGSGYYGGGGGQEGSGGGGSSYTDPVLGFSVVHTRGYNTTSADSVLITPNCSGGVITGVTAVCAGFTTALSDTAAGGTGTWISSNTSVATVGTSGIVTGVTAGTTTISYSALVYCGSAFTIATVTVNPMPGAIAGTKSVCTGYTTTLSDALAGGSWNSSNTTIATIGSSSGVVTGISAGTATITYAAGIGVSCIAVTTVTVNPTPVAITGTPSVCLGSTTLLSDAGSGGAWSSSNTSVATVSGTGLVNAVSVGTAAISYGYAITGCYAFVTVTVNPLPLPITGVTSVCVGATTSLTDAGGGTWTSSNTGVATIGSGSGIVAGIAVGSSTITYTLPTGCSVTIVALVQPIPATITGTTRICQGLTTILSDATGGGTWSSSNTSVADVGSSSGVVTGITGAGTATITYATATGCIAITVVTVDPLPSAITGTASACVGATTTLSDAGGGTWLSGSTTIATIGSGTGVVTGMVAGTATITYTLATGCTTTTIVTIYPLPAAITGTANVCAGSATALTDATTGGTWSSSNTTIATVGGTGMVTGLSAGTATITYKLSGTGCAVSIAVTVNPLPSAITGTAILCAGSTTTLSNATAGGAWSSSNTTVAAIGSGTGVVIGVSGGTATISYVLGTGCGIAKIVTVNPLPAVITGPTAVCSGAAITLSSSVGGTWTSSATSVATVSSTGTVTGIIFGTTTISYTLPTGCMVTTTVSVSPGPTAILGASRVCAGLTIALSDAVGGGGWSSSATVKATIDPSTGVVAGVSVGTATISYSLGGGCMVSKTITVSPSPAGITGATSVCIGSTTALSDITAGGTWSSSNTAVALISSSGLVSGSSAGTATISYTNSSGCPAIVAVTVNPAPTAITGTKSVCVGAATTLSDAVSGGIWSSISTAIAIIGSGTGIITGVGAGTTTISYSIGGCSAVTTVMINPSPAAITGTMVLCVGTTATLSDATPGGTWASGSTSVATITPGGIVTGLVPGTSVISYSLSCLITTTVTVNSGPSAIIGTTTVCQGTTTILSDAVTGGSWTSSSSSVAVVGSGTGIVTGVSPGTAAVTYAIGAGCLTATVITVDPLPASITGSSNICIGSTTVFSDATPGGTWGSSNTGVATIAGSGLISSVSVGASTITYTAPSGCIAAKVIIVNSLPPAITGPSDVCVGSIITLSDVGSGTWTSSNTSTATIGLASGIVSGILAGTTTVTYSLGAGCTVTAAITVNAIPAAITGTTHACVGQTTTLFDAVPGGNWSSGNTSVAAINTSGVVTAITAGTATVSYAVSGCPVTTKVTINPLPGAISGSAAVCAGSAAVFSDASPGGTWSSSITTVAVIGLSTGITTGLLPGTSAILYVLPTGCSASTILTVDAMPLPVSGAGLLCGSTSVTLSDAVPGGVWSSGNTAVATIGSSTGIVSGGTGGMAVIAYTIGTGCRAVMTVTVNPAASPITGVHDMCNAGSVMTISDADVPTGTWTSYLVTITSRGLVTAYALGAATITYTLPSGCFTTATLTVDPQPGMFIAGTPVCTGASILFTDTTLGGTWTSSNTLVATAGPATGLVSGINPGTAIISYTMSAPGCFVADTITVYSSPSAITGAPQVCMGAAVTFSDALSGGTWTSSSPPVAAVVITTGDVMGVSSGSATITYTSGAGCIATQQVTVLPLPLLFGIAGGGSFCATDTGVHVTLSGSAIGINYDLYNGPALTGSLAGTGLFLDFGRETVAGTYTAIATDIITGCSSPMSGSATVIVNPLLTPAVTVNAIPGTTVCEGTPVSYSTSTANGGSSPVFLWNVNGVISGSGASYSNTPVNGDVVVVMMTSNATCVSPKDAYGFVTMSVVTPVAPVVTITADPGTAVHIGARVTFTATVTNSVPALSYQWLINNIAVPGQTNSTFICSSIADNDIVSCTVTSAGVCMESTTVDVHMSVNSAGVKQQIGTYGGLAVTIKPNPNNGTFTIIGYAGLADENLSLELTDMIGQIVYRGNTVARNGVINEQLLLKNKLANGMYLLTIRSEEANKTVHVVIEQ